MAVTVEVSAGLLLYSEAGFLPALTLVLTVECSAAVLGLWSGSFGAGGSTVEHVRRRWFFALVAFAIAAVLSGGRTLWAENANGALAQGAGLAFLGTLPVFALGSLLGAMARRDGPGGSPLARVGIPAVTGMALGFLLTGTVLVPRLAPYSIFLSCMVVLSAGALLQGWILDRRIAVVVRAERGTPLGAVRVEDRAVGGPRREVRLLLEGGRVRGAESPGGQPMRGWESAVLGGLAALEEMPESVLYLGGGSGTLAGAASAFGPGTAWTLTELNSEVFDLANEFLSGPDDEEEVHRVVGDPFSVLGSMSQRFALVLLDCEALPQLGDRPYLRPEDWERLRQRTLEGGVVILGGLCTPEGGLDVAVRLARGAATHFPEAFVLESSSGGDRALFLESACRGTISTLVLGSAEGVVWLRGLPGSALRSLAEG
jgi:hypothetical protein